MTEKKPPGEEPGGAAPPGGALESIGTGEAAGEI